MRELTAQALHSHLKQTDGNLLLLDVREHWEFEKARLPDSLLIPLAQIPQRIEELDPETETVVICHHGIRSRAVGRFLEQRGFARVINLHGGVDAWAKEVDPTMPIY